MAVRSVGGPHGAQLLLEVLDLVAQPGGELEVEVLGGGVHLLGELVDEFGEVACAAPASFSRTVASAACLRRARTEESSWPR